MKGYNENKREIYKEYRKEHKEKIYEYNKEYYKNNKKSFNKKVKEYREANKDIVKQQNKKYRDSNKDKLKERDSTIITCECGCVLTFGSKSKHEKSKKHLSLMEAKTSQQDTDQS